MQIIVESGTLTDQQLTTDTLCSPPHRKAATELLLHMQISIFLLSVLAYDLTDAFGKMLPFPHASRSCFHPICFIPKYLNLLCLHINTHKNINRLFLDMDMLQFTTPYSVSSQLFNPSASFQPWQSAMAPRSINVEP